VWGIVDVWFCGVVVELVGSLAIVLALKEFSSRAVDLGAMRNVVHRMDNGTRYAAEGGELILIMDASLC
jgi:hypothetical protein